MQTITPNTSLAQVIQNPLGRDLLEKVLLNFGFKPEDFERSALSKLKVKALSPLTGGVIKKSTVQMFCGSTMKTLATKDTSVSGKIVTISGSN